MKLYEWEAKAILQKYGLVVPRGQIAKTPDEAQAITTELGKPVFLKSQITISGRGKAGGIIPADNPAEAKKAASRLLGKDTKGMEVKSLLVEEKLDLLEQLYVSISIDRQIKRFVALVSASGGMDIETMAKAAPQEISRFDIDPLSGFAEPEALELVNRSGLDHNYQNQIASILAKLYKMALEYDAEMVEINPLGRTISGALVAVDARIILDDNAIFRHPEFRERNLSREEDTAREVEARTQGFSYIDLAGDIGIIGNGAGLVMATVDLVHVLGGEPANFLDIGGGARVDVIKNGVLLVMNKTEVKGVLVNILGGITRCDLVAEGIVEGLKAAPIKKPIAVRIMGTNEAEGQEILRRNGISYYPDMEQAAAAIMRNMGGRN